MSISPKQNLYLISAGFLTTIILIFATVVFPLIDKIKTGSAALAEQKIAADDFYQNWKKLESSKKALQQAQDELAQQTTFLAKDDALKFIMATENIAETTGNRQEISITNAPVKEKNAAKNEPVLKLQISLYGGFSNLLKFLIHMENAPYFNEATSLQIISLANKDNPGETINSTINLNGYYQP